MKKRILIIGLVFVLLFSLVIPISISSNLKIPRQSSIKNVITVDDEPGDADFTSIKEAVNFSSPGDTIEVYSGFYLEDEILITKENVSLLGISHELGEGDDNGKPFIKGNGTKAVFRVEASYVIVSNFTIENPHVKNHSSFVCGIYVAKYYDPAYIDDVTISDCIIFNTHKGIYVTNIENIRVINNHISNCTNGGISTESLLIMGFIATGNVITDCHEGGIHYSGFGNHINISGNRIKNCSVGIEFSGNNMRIYGNDIENCDIGINCGGTGNIFTKNNFKNYSQIGFWFSMYLFWPGKNRWIGNYWDTWIGVGPKIILGFLIFEWTSELINIMFLIP